MPKSPAPALRKKPLNADGWINIATGLGVLGRDKTVGGVFISDRLSYEECEELWRGNDIAARMVEVPGSEMLRQGFSIKLGDDDEKTKDIENELQSQCDDLEIVEKFETALNYNNAYGGAAIFLGAADGATDLRMPFNINTVSRLRFLSVFEPRELYPSKWYNNGLTKKFGEPELYRLTPYTMTGRESMGALSNKDVHESRFITFPGIRVSKRQRREMMGWGDSIFVRAIRALEMFDQTWAGAGVLLADFAQAVFKMKGLAEFIAANDDTAIISRARAMATARSVANMMIMDSEETFERIATPINGLPETLDKFSLRLAAAADMPVSLLLGQSPAGLNATGDSDIRFFYDRIQAKREKLLRRRIERIVKILMLSRTSPTKGIEPASWKVKFPSLWQETEGQKAETHYKQAQADLVYLEHSALSPDEVARSRFGGESYSVETALDTGSRDLLLKGTIRALTDPQPSALDPNDPIEAGASLAGTAATGKGVVPEPGDPAAKGNAAATKPAFTLTPTDLATIVKVNQALASIGLPPLTKPDGTPDPDGDLFMVEFQAKHKAVIGAAVNATEGGAPVKAPAGA